MLKNDPPIPRPLQADANMARCCALSACASRYRAWSPQWWPSHWLSRQRRPALARYTSLIRNETPRLVEVDGLTRTGRPSGAVLPTSVEAGSTADMTWSIPTADYWAIVVDGSAIDASLTRKMRQGCTPEVEIAVKATMEISFGCKPTP